MLIFYLSFVFSRHAHGPFASEILTNVRAISACLCNLKLPDREESKLHLVVRERKGMSDITTRGKGNIFPQIQGRCQSLAHPVCVTAQKVNFGILLEEPGTPTLSKSSMI